jgi:ankyrin repeat protein
LLHFACQYGCLRVVKLFLEFGACPKALDSLDRTPLMVLVSRKYQTDKTLPILELLVEHGGALDYSRERDGLSLLHFAADTGKVDVVGYLLETFSSTGQLSMYLNMRDTKNGMTALHRAAYNDHPDVVYRLLANGANANTVDKHGDSPLSDGTQRKHHLCCKLLATSPRDVMKFASLLKVLVIPNGHTSCRNLSLSAETII